jgi:hypothetical protein
MRRRSCSSIFGIHSNDVGISVLAAFRIGYFPDEAWSNIPVLTLIGNDGDRFDIKARQHADDLRVSLGMKGNTVTDLEFHHFLIGLRSLHVTQPFQDSMVELDELCLIQVI